MLPGPLQGNPAGNNTKALQNRDSSRMQARADWFNMSRAQPVPGGLRERVDANVPRFSGGGGAIR